MIDIPRSSMWSLPMGSRPNLNHSLLRGLRGWLPMNEGAGFTLYDVSAWRNDGDISTMEQADWTFTNAGRGLNNDTGNDFVDWSNAIWDDVPAKGSMSLWVRIDSSIASDGSAYGIFEFHDDTSNELLFRKLTNNTVAFRWRRSGNNDTISLGAASNFTDRLHHIVGTWDRDGDEIAAYVDGKQVGTSTITTQTSATFVALNIGRRGNATFNLAGTYANAMLWDRPLSPGEVRQLCFDPWEPFRIERPVTYAAGGGGSIIPQIMHHRRMMGVS